MSRCARNPAEYDRRITIERLKQNQAQDAGGHIAEHSDGDWEKFAAPYAKITTKGGKEFWKINRVEDTVDIVFHCPYSTTLDSATPQMRAVYRGQFYNIVSVINVDLADQEIEIQAKS